MSKVLPAQCAANIVLADGVPLPTAEILSEGVGESEGIAVLDEDKAYYLAKITPDLVATLEQVIEALGQTKTALDQTVEACNNAANALTTLDTNAFLIAADAGVPSPPVATADIAAIGTATGQITTAATAIDAAKTQLLTLKGILR